MENDTCLLTKKVDNTALERLVAHVHELKCDLCVRCDKPLVCSPRQSNCGHLFCSLTCTEGICPICNVEIEKSWVDRAKEKKVRSTAKVCCPRCTWVGYPVDFVEHLGSSTGCPNEPLPCPLCKEEFARSYLVEHRTSHCIKRNVACPFCNEQVVQEDLPQHQEKCPSSPCNCPNKGCNKGMKLDELEVHLLCCPLRLMKCTRRGCEVEFAAQDLMKHEKDEWMSHTRFLRLELQDTTNTFLRNKEKINELQELIEGGPAKSNPRLLPLLSGCSPHPPSSSGPTYSAEGNLVTVSGSVQLSSPAVFAKLPEGFRPQSTRIFVCEGSVCCRVDVQENGDVKFVTKGKGGGGSGKGTWVSLSGICFYAAN